MRPELVLDTFDLDTHELVMEVEEAFGIRILAAEAERTNTVGALHQLVLTKLGYPEAVACLSRPVFREVEACLRGQSHGDRRVRPRTSLTEFFGESPRTRWRTLQDTLEIDAGRMRLSPGGRKALFFFAAGSATLVAFLALRTGQSPPLAICAGAIALVLSWLALIVIARPYAARGPIETVSELTSIVLFRRFDALAARRWTDVQIRTWRRLANVIGAQMGVAPRRLLPETRFLGDARAFDDLLGALGAP